MPAVINLACFRLYFHFVHPVIQNGKKSDIARRGIDDLHEETTQKMSILKLGVGIGINF
jgi:hypothetical protein